MKEIQPMHVKNKFIGERTTLIFYILGLTDTLVIQGFLIATFDSLIHSLLISFYFGELRFYREFH